MPKVDLSDFEAVEASSVGGSKLRVDAILGLLDDDRRAALNKALREPFRPSVVAKVVSGWGHPLSDNAVRTWRQRNNV